MLIPKTSPKVKKSLPTPNTTLCVGYFQSKDWGKHHRHCGQSRMLLDDPDLKLSPLMANRLKSLEYYKPTIGASMSVSQKRFWYEFR